MGRRELILPEMFPLGSPLAPPELPRPPGGLRTRGVSWNLLIVPLEAPRCPYDGVLSPFHEEIAAEKALCSLSPRFPLCFVLLWLKRQSLSLVTAETLLNPTRASSSREEAAAARPGLFCSIFWAVAPAARLWARRVYHRGRD